MRTLRIEFTQPVGKIFPIYSYAIRAVQGTEYSHVRLRWVNSTGRDLIYEAGGSSVHFIGTLAQKQHKVKIVKYYEIDLNREEYRELIDTCMEYAGLKYGILQILGIGIALACNRKTNPFADGKYTMVCSELVGRVLLEIKKFEVNMNLDIAGPLEIDQCLENLTERQLVRVGTL